MKYLLNSAVITSPGLYHYRLIDRERATIWLATNDWQSCIGYAETAEALEKITGIHIPVNRVQVRMQPGDEALVFRLTRRVANPENKGSMTVDFVLANCEIGILKRIS